VAAKILFQPNVSHVGVGFMTKANRAQIVVTPIFSKQKTQPNHLILLPKADQPWNAENAERL
jgi:hypothetical protein